MKFQKIKSSAVALIAVTLICKLIGMLRDIVLANYYGTSAVSDAYLIAVSVPTLIFYFVGHSISTAYLPMYNQVKKNKGELIALDYTNNLTCIALLIVAVLVVALIVFTTPILKLFAPGFDESTMALTVRFVRVSAASLLFMTLVSVWTGYLQANRNFVIPGSVSFVRNVVIILSIVFSARFGLLYLGIGLLVAYVAECILLLPFAWRAHYRPKLRVQLKEEEVKQTLYLILPILLGVCVSQVNKVVDRSIASSILTGGVSALTYASVLNTAIQEVLVTGVITILFAHCAELVAQGEHEKVKAKLSKTINALVLILLPASVGVIILAEEVVTNILCRGNFDASSVHLTTGALRFYSCGIVFLAIRDTLVKLFYAYKDTKTTTVTSIIAIALNIGLNLLLSRFIGINGLAAATSIAAAAQCIVLYVLLCRKIGDFHTKSMAVVLLKSALAAGLMAGLLSILKHSNIFSALPAFLSFLIMVLIGIAIYFAAAFLLRIAPLIDLHAAIRQRIRKDNYRDSSDLTIL